MIYTARMEVETTGFDDADADLRTLVEDLGGYFEQAAAHNYSSGYRSGDYTARIPADQFQAFLDRVGTICHVTYKEEGSENVSEAYYDAESRLVTQQTKLERLQNLLAQAENMEDIITIESAISDTELEIERLTGTLRRYDSLVDYATVYISLQEVYQLSNVEEPATSFGSRMGAAFASGWRGFVSALESLGGEPLHHIHKVLEMVVKCLAADSAGVHQLADRDLVDGFVLQQTGQSFSNHLFHIYRHSFLSIDQCFR